MEKKSKIEVKAAIDCIIESLPHGQKMAKTDLWRMIMGQGYKISYNTLKKYVEEIESEKKRSIEIIIKFDLENMKEVFKIIEDYDNNLNKK